MSLSQSRKNGYTNGEYISWQLRCALLNTPCLRTDKGSQRAGKFSTTLCTFLRLQDLVETIYQPQTFWQVKLYIWTILERLWNYRAEHQVHWDLFYSAASLCSQHADKLYETMFKTWNNAARTALCSNTQQIEGRSNKPISWYTDAKLKKKLIYRVDAMKKTANWQTRVAQRNTSRTITEMPNETWSLLQLTKVSRSSQLLKNSLIEVWKL